MSVLTLAQRAFLSRFFARPNAQTFYLTGGAALAEFYLHHRYSQDLDLFTQDRVAWENIETDLQAAAEQMGARLEFKPAKGQNELHRALLEVADEPILKIDIVRDAPPHFGEVVVQPDGVRVDSLDNIAVGKLLAAYGRAYPRDFVDLYFLFQRGVSFVRLITLGKEKDPGLEENYLADMLHQAERVKAEYLPTMVTTLDLKQLQQFFVQLADELAAGRKPNE